MKKVIIDKIIENPKSIVEILIRSKLGRILSDRRAISILYRMRFKHSIHWDNPVTLNEKLLWITVYDRNPMYTIMVDKYEAKNWIRKKLIGSELGIACIIPTYGIYEKFDDINFDVLPKEFVIKATHDSGTVVVCSNKDDIDYKELRRRFSKSLKKNYYWFSREWPYKYVQPRIIVEKRIESDKSVPEDYKIFCFNGKARFWFYASDRDTDVKFDFYDMDWNKLPVKQGHPNSDYSVRKPKCWNDMVLTAEKLSEGIPHVRVDFFVDKNGQYYVGELTLTHFSGLVPFEPKEWDVLFGKYFVLPSSKYI